MRSLRKYMAVVFTVALLAGCSGTATSAQPAETASAPPASGAEASAVELSDDPAIALLSETDPELPSFSFRWPGATDLFTIEMYTDPAGYEDQEFKEGIEEENEALKVMRQLVAHHLNTADLEEIHPESVDYDKLMYVFELNDENHSKVSLYEDGIVKTDSSVSETRYYQCPEEVTEQILSACNDGVQHFMAVNDSQAENMYDFPEHTDMLDQGTPVKELDDAGITTLLSVLMNEELGYYGTSVVFGAVDELPDGADQNLDYVLADGFTSKEALKNYALTYLPEEYLQGFDDNVIEYDGKVLIGRGAMGWGNDLFNPTKWEKEDDGTVHAQFIHEGDPVTGVYAKVSFRKEGDHWIVDTLQYPDYDSASGWKNPQ